MSRSSSPNSDQPLGGRYNIISQLGVGGFGRTFLAEDLHLPGNPQCVIKQLKPQIKSDDTLQTARRCFDTEAQVLYQLGDHDQIPRLLAHFEDEQEFYLAQELIEGQPLTKELVEGQAWTDDRAIALLKEILNVLVFVHEQNVIHRDLKPSNLMRRQHDQKIVLIDFGAVKQVSAQTINPETGATNLTISIGTHGYMPNEQLAGKPRFSSDIYAVGILGIQMLTGLHPKYLGEDDNGEIDWRHLAPHVSPELAAIIDRMVRYDFRQRYQTAIDALDALERLPVAIAEPSPPVPSSPPPAPPPVLEPLPVTVLDATHIEQAADEPEAVQSPSDSQSAEFSDSTVDPASTTAWLPTASLAQPPTLDNSTALTQSIGRPQLPESKDHLAPPRRLISKSLVWFGGVVVVVAAAGVIFAVVKLVIMPEFASQPPVSEPTSVEPSPQPIESPSPTPISPAQQAAELANQGDRLAQEGDYPEALKLYDRAIALKSDLAPAHSGRCETLNRLQRPEEALVACDDALAYKPNDPNALWSKGNALLLQNQVAASLRLYEQVTRLKPDFSDAWVKQGVALQRLGRSAEALAALDRSLGLERNSVEAWITRGQALTNLGRYDPAIASLDKAIQLDPDNQTAQKLRQQLREKLGR